MSFQDIGDISDRRAETRVYTQAEVDAIIARYSVKQSVFVTDQTTLYRRVEYLENKLVNYQLHSETLVEYLRVKRIPRGLRLNIRPNFCKACKDFCVNWYKILNKCSLDLIALTVEGLQQDLVEIEGLLSDTKKKLFETGEKAVIEDKLVAISSRLPKHREEVLERKLDKFRRDTVDYLEDKVYFWRQQREPRNFQRRNRNTNDTSLSDPEGTSGDSESSTHVRFLGRAQERDAVGGGERVNRKVTAPVITESKKRYPGRTRQQTRRW
ncbi:Hypothetical predicted protein [Pelobates cultripes]|uniref:Uncharacterized protein n=1 Tax=Pelobates cultripes TaxID=61616 RepID=A0AAD1SGG3_PELCU|nr:Hypothetical predicted protein [Pelobates cultripes]